MLKKRNTILDTIACIKGLQEAKYGSPKTTCFIGRSAGGIPAGRCGPDVAESDVSGGRTVWWQWLGAVCNALGVLVSGSVYHFVCLCLRLCRSCTEFSTYSYFYLHVSPAIYLAHV